MTHTTQQTTQQTTAPIMTRAEYMQDDCHLISATKEEREAMHRRFYGQFITPQLLKLVAQHFPNGPKAYPLEQWDRFKDVTPKYIDRDKWREAMGHTNPSTYPWSLSDNVCILKEAAQQNEDNKTSN